MMDAARERERERAREYLRTRGTLLAAPVVRERVAAAFATLESFLDSVPAERAAARPLAGEWTIHEVVDHLLETNRGSLDELRCLLAGQPPPGGPIPAALHSRAPFTRPWPWLLRELRRVDRDIIEALEGVGEGFATAVRAPVVLVIAIETAGARAPIEWVEELDWKAYAIVLRLHAIDHLNQAKKVLSAG